MRTAAVIAFSLPLLAAAQPAVPGFDRFPRNTPAEKISAGEVLITELNCVACHAADKVRSHRFQLRPAPVLFTNHNPAAAGWLRHWLLDPHQLKRGTTMPDLLHGMAKNEKARAVDALRHYLVSITKPLAPEAAIIGRVAEGKKLFQTIGCARCQGQRPGCAVGRLEPEIFVRQSRQVSAQPAAQPPRWPHAARADDRAGRPRTLPPSSAIARCRANTLALPAARPP